MNSVEDRAERGSTTRSMATPAQALAAAPIPPQDLDAEENVLGAMMLSPGAIGAVSEFLDASDFYRESHGKIYRAAIGLYGHGSPVDAITLVEELRRRNELNEVGGSERIHELAALVPAAANAAHYAQIVHEAAVLRRIASAGREIVGLTEDRQGLQLPELLALAEQKLFEASQERVTGELLRISDGLTETFDRIAELYKTKSEVTGVASGFRDLDRITAGFQPGNLIILAARPSMGKSALGLAFASNAATRTALPTAFFGLEMSRQEIVQRLMCTEGKVDSHRIRTGTLQEDDWARLAKVCSTLEKAPLYIDDSPALTMLDMRSRIQILKRREPDLALIVVDYLQLMSTGTRVESRLQEVSAISRGLKALARDFEVPVIALSQLSRALEQRQDKRPILSDLRESGGIEQDADVVMFLYRDDYYLKGEEAESSESAGTGELHVAKHRNGPTDTIKLAFQKRYAKFASLVQ